MWCLVVALLAIGFYGMLTLWAEFGGNDDTNEMGVWVSGFGWGGAALVVVIQLWKAYSIEIMERAAGALQAARGKTRQVKRKSRSDKAYEEIMKLKALRDAEVITKQEFHTKTQELKKDIL